jgi:hypothetical protein
MYPAEQFGVAPPHTRGALSSMNPAGQVLALSAASTKPAGQELALTAISMEPAEHAAFPSMHLRAAES